MREIKLRAWYKTLNIMCDVAAINFYYGNVVLLAKNEEQRKLFEEMNKKVLIECDDRLSVSMNEVELMQYVCVDDTGQDVYESDIVKYYEFNEETEELVTERIGEIYFDDNYELNYTIRGEEPSNLGQYMIKVIGNRYENPDLIKMVNS